MKTPEDPTRDPASEARDDWEQLCQPLTDEERRENARKIEALSVPDRFALMFSNASEPRATPETDAAAFAVEHRGINNGWNTEQVFASHARKLERQRDELIEALEFYRQHMLLGYDITDSGQVAEAAIAAVKGGNG
jgi:hypothetical protein